MYISPKCLDSKSSGTNANTFSIYSLVCIESSSNRVMSNGICFVSNAVDCKAIH